MFVSYVEPNPSGGDEIATLGILVDKSPDGTRGSVTVLFPSGGQITRHNVPIFGNEISGGAHIKLEPPSGLGGPEDTTNTSYSVGSDDE